MDEDAETSAFYDEEDLEFVGCCDNCGEECFGRSGEDWILKTTRWAGQENDEEVEVVCLRCYETALRRGDKNDD